jgi:GTP-binding protein Era
MLKEIGRRAREDMENLFGTRVFLELWVKVKEDWRNEERLLKNFGYQE